jgi:hypothetical protein
MGAPPAPVRIAAVLAGAALVVVLGRRARRAAGTAAQRYRDEPDRLPNEPDRPAGTTPAPTTAA